MNIEQLIRDYIPQVVHMSLATSKDNIPWISEVHFACDEELNIYFRSLITRRHSQEIALNPFVAGNIIKHHEVGQSVRGVYFEGKAELLESEEDLVNANTVLQEKLNPTVDFLEDAKNGGHQFYKITVNTFYLFDSIESKPSQKYELPWH